MLRERLDVLSSELMAFWLDKGVDREHRGFHGTLDRRGMPVPPTDKGLVQQSRHLWTLSLWFERRVASDEVRTIAAHTYRFIVDAMSSRDGEFFFKVSRDGSRVVEPKKQLYGQSFAIYGLAAYGRVFGVDAATERALRCFRAMDARAHDAVYGGYDQSRDPGWHSPGAQKETNTHIHLLEAFTELYRATGDSLVRERLCELVDLTAQRLFQAADRYVHTEFSRDWSTFGSPICSYGHDIETAWLLMDAAEALSRHDEPALVEAATSMGRHASDVGFDELHGGFFEEGLARTGATKFDKVWWIQAEALLGLLSLWALTQEQRDWHRLERTLSFIERHLRDAQYGEWYWATSRDGSAVGPRGDHKGEEWKTSYHSVRATVFASDWLREGRCPGTHARLCAPR